MKIFKLFLNSIVSILIVIICVIFFINNSKSEFNLEELFVDIISGWYYLFLACIILICNVYLRTYRWKYLFNSETKLKFNFLFKSQLIGYFINNISPIRIGDLVRSYVVSKKTNQKMSYIVGTIAMERFLDTITIMFFGSILIFHYGLDYLDIKFNLISSSFIIWLLLAFGAIFLCYKFFFNTYLNKIFKNFWLGFSAIQFEHKKSIIIYSILIWCFYSINVFLIQSIFSELQLNIFDCLLILVSASLLQMIPIGFGGLGVFHLGVQGVLNKLGFQDYNNFIILLHIYSLIIYTVYGGYFFFSEKILNIKNIYRDLLKD
jgi:glycosyltransferase 2 family protein